VNAKQGVYQYYTKLALDVVLGVIVEKKKVQQQQFPTTVSKK
jgi:hypothetical protein